MARFTSIEEAISKLSAYKTVRNVKNNTFNRVNSVVKDKVNNAYSARMKALASYYANRQPQQSQQLDRGQSAYAQRYKALSQAIERGEVSPTQTLGTPQLATTEYKPTEPILKPPTLVPQKPDEKQPGFVEPILKPPTLVPQRPDEKQPGFVDNLELYRHIVSSNKSDEEKLQILRDTLKSVVTPQQPVQDKVSIAWSGATAPKPGDPIYVDAEKTKTTNSLVFTNKKGDLQLFATPEGSIVVGLLDKNGNVIEAEGVPDNKLKTLQPVKYYPGIELLFSGKLESIPSDNIIRIDYSTLDYGKPVYFDPVRNALTGYETPFPIYTEDKSEVQKFDENYEFSILLHNLQTLAISDLAKRPSNVSRYPTTDVTEKLEKRFQDIASADENRYVVYQGLQTVKGEITPLATATDYYFSFARKLETQDVKPTTLEKTFLSIALLQLIPDYFESILSDPRKGKLGVVVTGLVTTAQAIASVVGDIVTLLGNAIISPFKKDKQYFEKIKQSVVDDLRGDAKRIQYVFNGYSDRANFLEQSYNPEILAKLEKALDVGGRVADQAQAYKQLYDNLRVEHDAFVSAVNRLNEIQTRIPQNHAIVANYVEILETLNRPYMKDVFVKILRGEKVNVPIPASVNDLLRVDAYALNSDEAAGLVSFLFESDVNYFAKFYTEEQRKKLQSVGSVAELNNFAFPSYAFLWYVTKKYGAPTINDILREAYSGDYLDYVGQFSERTGQINKEIIQAIANLRSDAYRYIDFARDEALRQQFGGKQPDVTQYTQTAEDLLYIANLADYHLFGLFGKSLNPFTSYSMTAEPSRVYKYVDNLVRAELQKRSPLEIGELMRIRQLTDDAGTEFVGQILTDPQTWIGLDIFFDVLLKPAMRFIVIPGVKKFFTAVGNTAIGKAIYNVFVNSSLQSQIYRVARENASAIQSFLQKSRILENQNYQPIDEYFEVAKKYFDTFGSTLPQPQDLLDFYVNNQISPRLFHPRRVRQLAQLIQILGEERARDIIVGGVERGMSAIRLKSLLNAIETVGILTHDERRQVLKIAIESIGLDNKGIGNTHELVKYLQQNFVSAKDSDNVIEKIFEGLKNNNFSKYVDLRAAYFAELDKLTNNPYSYFNIGRIIGESIYRNLASVNAAWENSPFLRGSFFGVLGEKVPELRRALVLIDKAYRNFMSLWIKATLARFPSWAVFNYLSNAFIYITMAGKQSETLYRMFRFFSPDTVKKILEDVGIPPEEVTVVWNALETPITLGLSEGESAILFGKDIFRLNIFEHLRTVYKENKLAAKSLFGHLMAVFKTLPDTVRSVNNSIESYVRLLTYYEIFKQIAKEHERALRNLILNNIDDMLKTRLRDMYTPDEINHISRAIKNHIQNMLDISGYNIDALRRNLELTFYNIPNIKDVARIVADNVGKTFDITSPNSVTLKLVDFYLAAVDEAIKQGKKLTPATLEEIYKQMMNVAQTIMDQFASTKMENILNLVLDDLEVTKPTKQRAARKAVQRGEQVPRTLTPEQQVRAFGIFQSAISTLSASDVQSTVGSHGSIIVSKVEEIIKGADDETLEFISDITGLPKEQLAKFSKLKRRTREKILGTITGILESNRISEVMEREQIAEEAVEQAKKEVEEVTVTFGEFLNDQFALLNEAIKGTREAGRTLTSVLEEGVSFIDNTEYNRVYHNLLRAFDVLNIQKENIRNELQKIGRFDEQKIRSIANQLSAQNPQAVYDILVGFIQPGEGGVFTRSLDDFVRHVENIANFLRVTKANFDALFPLDKTNPNNFSWILLEESGLSYDAFRSAEHLLKEHAFSRIAEEVYKPIIAYLKGDADSMPDLTITAKRFLSWLGIEVVPSNAPDKNFAFQFTKDVLGSGKTNLPIKGQAEAMLLSVLNLDGPEALERSLTTNVGKFQIKLSEEDIKQLNRDIDNLLNLKWADFSAQISNITNQRARNLKALSVFNIPTLSEDGLPLDNQFPKRIANWITRKMKEAERAGDKKVLSFYTRAYNEIRNPDGSLKSFDKIDTVYVFGYAKDWFERRHTANVAEAFTLQLSNLESVFKNIGLPEAVSKRLIKGFDDVIDKLASNLGLDADELRRSFVVKLLHDKFDFSTHWGIREKEEIVRRVSETIGRVRSDIASGRTIEESLSNRFTKDELNYFNFKIQEISKQQNKFVDPQIAERVFIQSQYAERHIIYNFKDKGTFSVLFVSPVQVNKIDYIPVGFSGGNLVHSITDSGELFVELRASLSPYRNLSTLADDVTLEELVTQFKYKDGTPIAVKNLLHYAYGNNIDRVVIETPRLANVATELEDVFAKYTVVEKDKLVISTIEELNNFLENNTVGYVYDPSTRQFTRYRLIEVDTKKLFEGGYYRPPFTSEYTDIPLGTIEYKGLVDAVKNFEIVLHENANATTIMHEMMHLFSYLLPDDVRANLFEQIRNEVKKARQHFARIGEMPEWLVRRADDQDDQAVLWEYLARAMEFKIVFGDEVPEWLNSAANYLRMVYLSMGDYFSGINLKSDLLDKLDIIVKQLDVNERMNLFKKISGGKLPPTPPKLNLAQTLRKITKFEGDQDWLYMAAMTVDFNRVLKSFDDYLYSKYPHEIAEFFKARALGDKYDRTQLGVFWSVLQFMHRTNSLFDELLKRNSVSLDNFYKETIAIIDDVFRNNDKVNHLDRAQFLQKFFDSFRAILDFDDFWRAKLATTGTSLKLRQDIVERLNKTINEVSFDDFVKNLFGFYEWLHNVAGNDAVKEFVHRINDIHMFVYAGFELKDKFSGFFSKINKPYTIRDVFGKELKNEEVMNLNTLGQIDKFAEEDLMGMGRIGTVARLNTVNEFNDLVNDIERIFGDYVVRDKDGNILTVFHYSKHEGLLFSLVPTNEGIHLGSYTAALDRKSDLQGGGFYQYVILGKNGYITKDFGKNDVTRHLLDAFTNLPKLDREKFYEKFGWYLPTKDIPLAINELILTARAKIQNEFSGIPNLFSAYQKFLSLPLPRAFDENVEFIVKVEKILDDNNLRNMFGNAYAFVDYLFERIREHFKDGIQYDVVYNNYLEKFASQTQKFSVELDDIVFDTNIFFDRLFANRWVSPFISVGDFLWSAQLDDALPGSYGFLEYAASSSLFTKYLGIDYLVYKNTVEGKGSLSYMVFSPRQLKRIDSTLFLPSTRNYDSLHLFRDELKFHDVSLYLSYLDLLDSTIDNVETTLPDETAKYLENVLASLEQLAQSNVVYKANDLGNLVGKDVAFIDMPIADVIYNSLGEQNGRLYEYSVLATILDVAPDASINWYYDELMRKYVLVVTASQQSIEKLDKLNLDINGYVKLAANGDAMSFRNSPIFKYPIRFKTSQNKERLVFPVFSIERVRDLKSGDTLQRALNNLYSKNQEYRYTMTVSSLSRLGYDEKFTFRIPKNPAYRDIEIFLKSADKTSFVLYVLSVDNNQWKSLLGLENFATNQNLPAQLYQTVGRVTKTPRDKIKRTLFATFNAIDFGSGLGQTITLKNILDSFSARFPNLAQSMDIDLLPGALRHVASTLPTGDHTRTVLEHLASIYEIFNKFADDYIDRHLTINVGKAIAQNNDYFVKNPEQFKEFVRYLFDYYGLDYGLRRKIYAASLSPTLFTHIEEINDAIRDMWLNQISINELETFVKGATRVAHENAFDVLQVVNLGTNHKEVADDLINHVTTVMENAKHIFSYGGKMEDVIEVEKGAIQRMNELLVDYTKRTPFDNFMRSIFPFWMYPAKSLRIWLEAIVTRPYIMSAFSKYIKLSETMMRQNVMVDSNGRPLNSYYGFVPILPGLWVNITTPFLFRYAMPRFYDDDVERAKQVITGEIPLGQSVSWALLEFFPNIGLYPNPIIANILRQFYDSQYPEPSLTYEIARLFLPLEYFPPFLQRSITYTLNKFIYGKDTAEMFLPNVSWMDYLVERELLMKYYNRIINTEDPTEREQLAKELQSILADPNREENPIWNEVVNEIQDSDWARMFIGRMTGFYAKPYTSAVADLRKIVREVRTYRIAINNAVMKQILDIPDAPDVMYQNYIESAYGDNPKAMVYSLYTTLNAASYASGKELIGEERRKAIAEELKRIEDNNLYYTARAKLRQQLESDLMNVDVGDKKAYSEIYQKYFESLAELDKRYTRTNNGIVFGYKPYSVILDKIENKWWDYLKSTMPTYNSDEDYGAYKKAMQDWYNNLPMLARALAPVFVVQLNSAIPDNEKELEERGLEVASIVNTLVSKSNYEGYQEYRRKNDSVIEAIWEAFQVKYVDEYFKVIAGKKGQERYLAERQFFEKYADVATNKERVFEWVKDIYGDRISRSQIMQVLDDVKVLDIDEAISRGKTQEEIVVDKIWDLLNKIGYIGSNQYDAVIEAYKDLGGNVRLLDVFLTSGGNPEAFKNPNDLYNLYSWLQDAVEIAGIKEPTIEEIKERIHAKSLDDNFKSKVKAELGSDIFEIMNAYFQLSTSERKRWRIENPDAWLRIQKYYEMRDEYAKQYPVWAKYFHPNYKGTDNNGNVVLQSGGVAGYTASSLRSSRKRDYFVDYTIGMGRRAGSDILQIMLRDLYGRGGATLGIPIYKEVINDISTGKITVATKTYLKESAKNSQLLSQPLRDLLDEIEKLEKERFQPIGHHGGGRRRTVKIE